MSRHRIDVSDEAIDTQLNRAINQADTGGTKYRGQTYEEGVRDALSWILGDYEDAPLGDEYDED